MATGAVSEDNVQITVGGIGAFEISIDGETKYSKLKTKRFPTDADLQALV